MLDNDDRKLLLTVARERIDSGLAGRTPAYPDATDALRQPSGAFVTLHIREGSRLNLRGCIGHIEAVDSVYNTVISVAESAAFQDYRFHPLTAEEWPRVLLEISVISPFTRVRNVEEIVPGRHGLYMRRGARSGLLLPQVAAERKWDRTTFLAQTCRKAGLPEDAWQDSGTEISVFTAEVFDEQTLNS